MHIICGNGGTGKSFALRGLCTALDEASLSYTFVGIGEPDLLSACDGIQSVSDFYDLFASIDENVIIVDSLRLLASLPGALGAGGVNKRMANYITFLELAGRKFGKVVISAFNPLDDDANVGGYFNILKSSCSSVILLDNTNPSKTFASFVGFNSSGYVNGEVICTSRFSDDRRNIMVQSSDLTDYLITLVNHEKEFLDRTTFDLPENAIFANLDFNVHSGRQTKGTVDSDSNIAGNNTNTVQKKFNTSKRFDSSDQITFNNKFIFGSDDELTNYGD